MKKSEYIKLFANQTGISIVEANRIWEAVSNFFEDIVAMGETINIPGIMTVGVKESKPRNAYDFNTGTMKLVEPKTVPFIRVGKKLKEAALNAPVKK